MPDTVTLAVETTDGLTQSDKDFWERAFLVVLPTAMTVQGWKFGEAKISTGDDRSRLAAHWADSAVLDRRARFDTSTQSTDIQLLESYTAYVQENIKNGNRDIYTLDEWRAHPSMREYIRAANALPKTGEIK